MPNRWLLHFLSLAAVIAVGAYAMRTDRDLNQAVAELRATETAVQSTLLALQASQLEIRRHERAIFNIAFGVGRLEAIEGLFAEGKALDEYTGETEIEQIFLRITDLAGYDTLDDLRETGRIFRPQE